MPQIPKKELYKSDNSFFNKSNYVVKIVEQMLDIHLENGEEEICILSKKIYHKTKG